jgi:hypothetical protein
LFNKEKNIERWIVAGWLTGVALSLLASWTYVDVAVRDLMMALSAFSMAKLATVVEEK